MLVLIMFIYHGWYHFSIFIPEYTVRTEAKFQFNWLSDEVKHVPVGVGALIS